MPSRLVRFRLTDIRDEIAGIQALTRAVDLATFAQSWSMRRAVQHALLIISEAAKNLPPEIKQTHP
jgi:uncharacterized protein with HEPN domain